MECSGLCTANAKGLKLPLATGPLKLPPATGGIAALPSRPMAAAPARAASALEDVCRAACAPPTVLV